MSLSNNPEQPRGRAALRVPPNWFVDVTIGAVAVHDMAAIAGDDPYGAPTTVDLTGRWCWFRALTLDVTLLRGDHVAGPLVAGGGVVLASADEPLEYYVPTGSGATTQLTIVAAGACVLRIFFDDDV